MYLIKCLFLCWWNFIFD